MEEKRGAHLLPWGEGDKAVLFELYNKGDKHRFKKRANGILLPCAEKTSTRITLT